MLASGSHGEGMVASGSHGEGMVAWGSHGEGMVAWGSHGEGMVASGSHGECMARNDMIFWIDILKSRLIRLQSNIHRWLAIVTLQKLFVLNIKAF
jgi:hypothetical protein